MKSSRTSARLLALALGLGLASTALGAAVPAERPDRRHPVRFRRYLRGAVRRVG